MIHKSGFESCEETIAFFEKNTLIAINYFFIIYSDDTELDSVVFSGKWIEPTLHGLAATS